MVAMSAEKAMSKLCRSMGGANEVAQSIAARGFDWLWRARAAKKQASVDLIFGYFLSRESNSPPRQLSGTADVINR